MNWWGVQTFSAQHCVPGSPQFISFLQVKCMHSISTALKLFIHSSINSKVQSPKYHPDISKSGISKTGGRIHPQAKFLSNCESVKQQNGYTSRIRWWDRYRIFFSIPTGRNKKVIKGDRSQESPNPSKANSICSLVSRIVLFGPMLCPPGPLVGGVHLPNPYPVPWVGSPSPKALPGDSRCPSLGTALWKHPDHL